MRSKVHALATFSILAVALHLGLGASAAEPRAGAMAQLSWKNFSINRVVPWLISQDGRLVMALKLVEPDEGPAEATIVFIDTATGAVVRSTIIGELPIYEDDQDAQKSIAEVNQFLKQHTFMVSGEAAGDLTASTRFGKESIDVTYRGKAYTGGYGSQTLENPECCRWTTLQADRYFPSADVILATIRNECSGPEDAERPCDCDGDIPDGDDFKYCPAGSSGTVFLKRAASTEAVPSVKGLDGAWRFRQFWNSGSEVSHLDGSCTIGINTDGRYDFHFGWTRRGEEKTSDYYGARLDGLLWAVDVGKPNVAFILGQGDGDGCLAGVFFYSVKGASISGLQLCPPDVEFDGSIYEGWNHERGRQILATMISWFVAGPPPDIKGAWFSWMETYGGVPSMASEESMPVRKLQVAVIAAAAPPVAPEPAPVKWVDQHHDAPTVARTAIAAMTEKDGAKLASLVPDGDTLEWEICSMFPPDGIWEKPKCSKSLLRGSDTVIATMDGLEERDINSMIAGDLLPCKSGRCPLTESVDTSDSEARVHTIFVKQRGDGWVLSGVRFVIGGY